MIVRLLSPAIALLLLAACRPPEQPASTSAVPPREGEFIVAPTGNDNWSGRRAAPDRGGTDGPLATPARALAAAREYKAAHPTAAPPTIRFRSGTYFLESPLVLHPEDSGMRLAAYPGEKPVLSGGRRIAGWRATTHEGRALWVADVPEARNGQWFFRELWVNGARRTRARHPNLGYFSVAALPDATATWTEGHRRFGFHAGDVRAWPTITNAEVLVMTRWVESRLPVTGVDEAGLTVACGKRSVFQLQVGDLYYLEHALEVLDAPGEWYLDPVAGRLFYHPLPGETPDAAEAIAPVLSQVVRLEGDAAAGRFVEDVAFSGLTFSHTDWDFPRDPEAAKRAAMVWPAPSNEVGGFAQAAVGVPSAVWGAGARRCVFEDCTFAHLGGYALELGRGCQSNRIAGCTLTNLGGGGIKLGETAVRPHPAEHARANEVVDCHIGDGGKRFHSAIGIWIGQSADNRIAHNRIHDFYYTGISIGWTWGYGPALASNNLVEFNHVHHIGVRANGDGPILSDMGGIYTLGRQPGTRIVNNLWHDIAGFRYGGWGIYFDEGSSSIVAESNVVYRTTHGGFHQHYGATNLVRNNVFAFARDHQLQRSREEPHVSFSFSNNVVYFNQGVLHGGTWKNNQFVVDANLYWDARPGARPEAMQFPGGTLAQWRARGHDLHSQIADPRPADPQQGNFSFPADSPVWSVGFHPIDLSRVGPRPAGRR